MSLPAVSLVEWLMIAGASWLILATVVAVPIGRAMRRADHDDTVPAAYPPPVPPSVQWMPELPPVPQPASYGDDWMDLVPVDALSDWECDRRFWKIAEDAL